MKKGLLSILASALLVVGCQNYDDQFSALETQINALASTVAGLSQVQSDLSTLAGTVNSLASTVNGLGSQIDTAVADGLADITADVEAIQTAVADVASSEEVAALSTAVADANTDLDELLAQASVYQGSIVVNSVSTLNVYGAIGAGLNIVNGSVTITNSTEMDDTAVQALIDNVLVTLEDFTYTAGTGVTTEMTFNNLTGTRSLTLDQKGGYVVQGLQSATEIVLEDDATTDIVDLRALTSVSSLKDTESATDGTFTFSNADELHLTALPRSPSTTLSLGVDEGKIIDITALTDADSAGKATLLNLTLDGPDTIVISKLSGDKSGSTVSLTNVANATMNGYDGTVTIGQDVENFTSDGLVDWSVQGSDLITVDITGILDPNATTADTAGPIVNLDGDRKLTTVTTAGTLASVTLNDNGDLKTVTIGGTITGATGITITSNNNVDSIDVSGATTDYVKVDGNSDLETLTIDYTTGKGAATTQEGTIIVNNNESLASLTIGKASMAVDNLTVTNNEDLVKIDFSELKLIGATGTAAVTITDNKLEATKSTDEEDGTANVTAGTAGDLGSFTETAGMSTAYTYLTAVTADADSAADVKFDLVESVVDSTSLTGAADTETSDSADVAILTLTAKVVSTAAIAAAKHKHAVAISAAATETFSIHVNGTTPLLDGNVTPNANATLFMAEIVDTANLTRASAYGVTLAAKVGAYSTGKIALGNFASATHDGGSLGADNSVRTLNVTKTATVNLTIDGVTMSGTVGGLAAAHGGWTDDGLILSADELINVIANSWQSLFVEAAGASEKVTVFVVNSDTTNDELDISTKIGSGSRGYDKSYSLTFTAATATLTSAVYGVTYGATSDASDNNTVSGGIVVTVEADTGGSVLDETAGLSYRFQGQLVTVTANNHRVLSGFELLTTSLDANANPAVNVVSSTDIFPSEARDDARRRGATVDEVATAATTFNRVEWVKP